MEKLKKYRFESPHGRDSREGIDQDMYLASDVDDKMIDVEEYNLACDQRRGWMGLAEKRRKLLIEKDGEIERLKVGADIMCKGYERFSNAYFKEREERKFAENLAESAEYKLEIALDTIYYLENNMAHGYQEEMKQFIQKQLAKMNETDTQAP